jgi:hypothetical protein
MNGKSEGGAPDLGSLFGNSQLSQGTLDNITSHDLGADITAALGTPVDSLRGSEMLLLSLLLDDSSSMSSMADVLIAGVNLIVDAVVNSKPAGDVLVQMRSLNDGLIFPATPIKLLPRLTRDLYRPSGATPLFDGSYLLLSTGMAKVEEAMLAGIPARALHVIISDGAPYGAQRYTARDVHALIKDMHRIQPEAHLVLGMGIDDGRTDFRALFKSMGIGVDRDEHILTPDNSPSAIRKAFQVASQSAATASQGAAGFSQAMNGL